MQVIHINTDPEIQKISIGDITYINDDYNNEEETVDIKITLT